MPCLRLFRGLIVAALLPPAVAVAEVPLDGVFVADRACPALLSLRKGTNPGTVALAPGGRYVLHARNRADGAHLRVQVPGAPVEERRWVEADCGRIATGAAETPAPARLDASRESRWNVLAATWAPAWCATAGRRPECRRAAPARFVLHGLWPQPREAEYCDRPASDRNRRWRDLAAPSVDADTADETETAMPGAASHLDRHQWAKHGSCYRADGGADEYFDDAFWLLAQLNASGLRDRFEAAEGRRLDHRALRADADRAFGRGAGARLEIVCRDGLILELRLHLSGRITDGESELGDLMRAADPVDPGCGAGRVQPARGWW